MADQDQKIVQNYDLIVDLIILIEQLMSMGEEHSKDEGIY